MLILFLFKLILRWRDSEVLKCRLLAVEARTAHDRFGLTHIVIVREAGAIRKTIRLTLLTTEAQSHGENPGSVIAKRRISCQGVGFLCVSVPPSRRRTFGMIAANSVY